MRGRTISISQRSNMPMSTLPRVSVHLGTVIRSVGSQIVTRTGLFVRIPTKWAGRTGLKWATAYDAKRAACTDPKRAI